jgi:protein TonB
MLISKFDLYKLEWLELVFENRNKGYGAYELRQHHNRTMVMAMTFTFLGVGILFGTSAILQHHHKTGQQFVDHVVTLAPPPDQTIKRLPPPVIPHTPPPPVATIRYVPPVVVPDVDVRETPPQLTDLTAAIGTTTTKGGPGDQLPLTIDEPAGPAAAVTEDNTVYPVSDIQIFPTPVGGEDAWNKFLSKNLRYPPEAQDAGVGGRVYMSFVVEKDGTLSNFTVERGAGYGMDEEAKRVLKLAKAWKPGLQNGRPVRVKFVIPINFQFGGDN